MFVLRSLVAGSAYGLAAGVISIIAQTIVMRYLDKRDNASGKAKPTKEQP